MRENFLHYIWRFRKYNSEELQTNCGKTVRISELGFSNPNAGPDILNALISIGGILWAGNVEFHTRASHWNSHGHSQDPAYNSVVLHVVWDADVEVFNSNDKVIPTLELSRFVTEEVFQQYEYFFLKPGNWINCEKQIMDVDPGILNNWFRELFSVRIKRKTYEVNLLLNKSNHDWEAVCFSMLAKYLAGPVNSEAFLNFTTSFDFRIMLKLRSELEALEALFFGQAGLLRIKHPDPYFENLDNRYRFLKRKFGLNNSNIIRIRFMRLRPDGFPTIRLSQLAGLYHANGGLFARIVESDRVSDFFELFDVEASAYWSSHYNFGKPSEERSKGISKQKKINLILNAVLPIRQAYENFKGLKLEPAPYVLAIGLPSETNNIVRKFRKLGLKITDARASQALLEMKTEYCDKNKCLQCKIGNEILSRNT